MKKLLVMLCCVISYSRGDAQILDSLKNQLKVKPYDVELLADICMIEARFDFDSSKFYLDRMEFLMSKNASSTFENGVVDLAKSTYENAIGNDKLSRDLLKKSIFEFQNSKNEYWISKSLLKQINFNIIDFKYGNFDSLENQFNLHAHQIKDEYQKAQLILQKDIIKTHYYNYYGYYDIAAKLAFDGLNQSKKMSNKFLEMKALEALISVFQMTNELAKAISYMRANIEITKDQAPLELYIRYANLATCELQQNNPQKANMLLDSAIVFTKYPKQLSFIMLLKGQMYSQEGNLALGKSNIDSAKKLFLETKNLARVADCNFILGDLYAEENDFSKAEKYYKESVAYFEDENNAEQKFGGYQALSQLYANNQKFQLAFEYANKCVYLQDTLNSERKIKEIKTQEIKYQTSLKEQQIKEQQNLLSLNQKKTNLILLSSLLGIFSFSSIFLVYRNKSKRESLQIEKEKIDFQLDSIRGKILPHFSGNVLNSITYFFESDQADKGVNYLTKFTELNKDILLSTKSPARSVKDELAFLNNYIDLEKIRYQDNLIFNLEVDVSVKLDTHIPVLILHTFCENAIRHGLMSKKGKGIINVHLKEQANEKLLIMIQDDGIGIDEAKQINCKSTGQGLLILSKQIELYNRNNKEKITFDIANLKDGDISKGTSVSIIIPHHFNYSA